MTEFKTIDFEAIKQFLPHRYPFLLVDRVLAVNEKSIRALKNVSANEPFFTGHFPELAVMPGVLQVEAMAQAAGLILAQAHSFDVNKQIAFLAGLEGVKFKRLVTPGDQLIIEVEIQAQRQGIVKFSAKALVDGMLASQASIVLAVRAR